MAVPHFSVKHGSRQQGRSAAAHFTYIVREAGYEKSDLEYVKHANYPTWAIDTPELFWKAADLYERKNGRMYTEFEIALPRELNKQQRIELLETFLATHLGDRHPYTAVIHTPNALDGKPNPHAHVMFTERRLDGVERPAELFFGRAHPKHPEKGGAAKDRELHHRSKVEELRLSWEQLTNKALERAGSRERVDLRNLRSRGIVRPPEPKLGASRTAMYRKGIVTEAAEEVMQIRLIASQEKERAQVRRELGRAKIAQYKEKREEQLEISATEVLEMVKKGKLDLYDEIGRSEKAQYELGGFRKGGMEEIGFRSTNDPFVMKRREELVSRHEELIQDLSDIKKYERELNLVGGMTLKVKKEDDWTKKEALVNRENFDVHLVRSQEMIHQQSVEQGREIRLERSRSLIKET